VLQRTRRKDEEALLVEFWVYGADLDGQRAQPQAVRQRVPAAATAPAAEEPAAVPDLDERGNLLCRPPIGARVLVARDLAKSRVRVAGTVVAYGAAASAAHGTVALQLDEGLTGHFPREHVAFLRYLADAEPARNEPADVALLRAAGDVRRADEQLPVGRLFRAAVRHRLLPADNDDGTCTLAVLVERAPRRGAPIALQIPVGDETLALAAQPEQVTPLAGEPGANDAALLGCLRHLPLDAPLLLDLIFKNQRVDAVPCAVVKHEERHFRVRLLYIQGTCVLRVPRQAASYRVRDLGPLAQAPHDWNEDKANQQLAPHALPKRGFLCAGTTVLLAPAAKTPPRVAQLLGQSAERGRVAADAHERQQLVALQFDFPNGRSLAASLPRALIGRFLFLDTAPVPNEREPPRRRDLVEVLDGEHRGAVGLVVDAQGAHRSVRLRTDAGVAMRSLPAEQLWVKDHDDDDEALRARLQEEASASTSTESDEG
jgi:hypothetical protein